MALPSRRTDLRHNADAGGRFAGQRLKVFGAAGPVFMLSACGLVDAVSPRYWDANGNYASAVRINDAAMLTGALGRTPGEAAVHYPSRWVRSMRARTTCSA